MISCISVSDGVSPVQSVYRSGVMECHDTMSSHVMGGGCDFASRHDMEWSTCLITTNKVSTGNAETMSAMEQLWDHRGSVWEGTVKQRNVKAWKATHFRSEDGKPTG